MNGYRGHTRMLAPPLPWLFVCVLGAAVLIPAAEACNVPVFRYALERWPADPHVVNFSTNLPLDSAQLMPTTDANLWCEFSREAQTQDVRVVYPDIVSEWYRGDYDETLLTRLCDSPLRRALAHELLTGTALAFVVLESSNTATNDAVCRLLESRLEVLEQEIEMPEVLDYSADSGAGTPVARDGTGPIPTKLDFTMHRLARDSAEEAFFVRQLVGMDEQLRDVMQPAVFAVFGRARCIPLFGETLAADSIDELCWFLCGACSCRVKAMNPGIDLLFSVNWDEAIYSYPESVLCVLPDGETYEIGGTQAMRRVATGMEQSPDPVAAEGVFFEGWSVARFCWVLGTLLIVVLGAIAFMRRKSSTPRGARPDGG